MRLPKVPGYVRTAAEGFLDKVETDGITTRFALREADFFREIVISHLRLVFRLAYDQARTVLLEWAYKKKKGTKDAVD